MEGWNSSYNWTYTRFVDVIRHDLEEQSKDVVNLDAEHSDVGNMNAMVAWARQLGYDAEISPNREFVRVFKRQLTAETGSGRKLGDLTLKEFCEYCKRMGIYMDSEKKCLNKCPFSDFCKNELNENGLPCARWKKYLDKDAVLDIG